jgi:hypothetical protein
MLASVDSALKAWVGCTQGYTLPAKDLPGLAPQIAECIPGGQASADSAQKLAEVFQENGERGDRRSLFLQMVKVHGGEVHFLYFWRAFSKIVRLVGDGEEGQGDHESLLTEFETLRDRIIRLLDAEVQIPDEVTGADSSPSMTAACLYGLVRNTESMSSVPAFWQRCAVSLGSPRESTSPRYLQLEDLTAVVFAWLYDVVTWSPPIQSQVQTVHQQSQQIVHASQTSGPRLAVRLHIYDVSHEDAVIQINQVFARKDSPVKLGGAFHVGVEVNNMEWCFGFSQSDTKPGVTCVMPRAHPNHHFRQSVFLGYTTLTAEDISVVISDLIEKYPGPDYDLLSRNCCHFADDFCTRLGVGHIPGWIHRFADIGTHLVGVLQTASVVRRQVKGVIRQARRDLRDAGY